MGTGIQLKLGLGVQPMYYPEHATSGSFVKGDPVDLAGGKVAYITADSKIFGIALADYSGTEDTLVPVERIFPDVDYVMVCDTTTAVAYVGEDYGLNIAAGATTVNVGETSTVSVVVQGLDPRDAVGTDGGRLIVRFKPAVIQGLTG